MNNFDPIKSLSQATSSKILLLVMDGLGGLPDPKTGKTELETARTPNLDGLSREGSTGLIDIVGPGITPGSSAGHLSLFGYDPLTYNIGRGALEAVGIDFELEPGDIAARGNFCSTDNKGLITDRRAGRIDTEECQRLCGLLDGMSIDNTLLYVRPVKEHRFILIMRGKGLKDDLSDSDPQQEGVPPRDVTVIDPDARATAEIVNRFIERAKGILAGHQPANMLLLRGFSTRPSFPGMKEIYQLKPAAIATYPMYRGLARLVGMDVLETGSSIEDELATLRYNYSGYDFFFVHIKGTDSAGEDGDFERKVKVIECLDREIPEIMSNKPDVLVVTGDHSTPAILNGHSWHPVPVLLYSKWCRHDGAKEFGETACSSGGLGHFHATRIMAIAMAHALKLKKFGA